MTESINELNKAKQAPDVDGVLPIFHTRWSPRSFTDREVSKADLAKVFEAARWAASSFNEQPWRFLVGTRNSTAYQKIFDSLMPFNQQWAYAAPVLILGTARTKFSHNGTPNRVALFDLGAASLPHAPGRSTRPGRPSDGRLRARRGPQGVRNSRRLHLRLGHRAGLSRRARRPSQRAIPRPGACAPAAQAAEGFCLLRMGRERGSGMKRSARILFLSSESIKDLSS